MDEYKNILSSINYGGITLKNRVIFAPTTLGLNKTKYLKFIEKLAKGGVGLIIIGDVPVGKSNFTPSLYKRSGFKLYQQINQIAHKYNCKTCAQLHQSDTDMWSISKNMPKLMSKKLNEQEKIDLMNQITSDYISHIPTEKVKKITSSFKDATLLVKKAGFDMIQLHGDRMCGSFSSTIFNKRKDCYGGDIFNRSLFAVESINAIREADKKIPIDFKLVVRINEPHYGNAGIEFDEIKDYVNILENAGVTSFHVTLANHSKLDDAIPNNHHPYFNKEGCFLKFVDEVRKYSNLPITAVGNLTHPDFIEEQIKKNRFDCVAMSRQLICDCNYVNKLASNKANDITFCIHCNKGCLGGLMHHKGVKCILDNKK